MTIETAKSEKPRLSDLGSDLLTLSCWQRLRVIALPVGAFASYWIFAFNGYWLFAVFSTMVLSFTTYGSTSHDLVHRNLGLPRWLNQLLLSLLEMLALRSGHAYQAAHLHHHARYPHDDDIEADASRMSLFRSLWEGVVFQQKIVRWAWNHAAGGVKAWIALEVLVILVTILLAVMTVPYSPVPILYVGLMIAGSWIIPLITSYLPHDPHGEDELHQTRRYRGLLIRLLSFDHLYHLEHHLYPAVPHIKWKLLAKRLDPWLDRAGVKSIKLWF